MGRRGPRPTPAGVKLAIGTFRKDRDGPIPIGETGVGVGKAPSPPASLGKIGKKAWKKLVPQLVAMGVFAGVDVEALAMYCRTFDEVADCDEKIQKEGRTFKTDKGYIGPHPLIAERFRWIDLRRRYEAEYGLTAAARAGLDVEFRQPTAEETIEPRRRG